MDSLRQQIPESMAGVQAEVRDLSEEERTLEARLERALTPQMRERLRKALTKS